MEEIRQDALEFFSKCSMEVQAFAKELFEQMDHDRSASISYAELYAFVKGNKFLSRLSIDKELFDMIDKNGNGRLDYKEYITFFYVVFASAMCDGCGAKLMRQRRFTCRTCFAAASDTLDLCVTCFSAKRFKHVHVDFLDFSFVASESSILQTVTVKDKGVTTGKMDKRLEGVRKTVATVVEVTNTILEKIGDEAETSLEGMNEILEKIGAEDTLEGINSGLEFVQAVASCNIM